MNNIGVAIMYLTIGIVNYKLVDRLGLRKSEISIKIGKYMYRSGIVIFFSSIASLFPFVPKNFSTIVLALTVMVMAVLVLKRTQEFRIKMEFDTNYYCDAVKNRDREKFELAFEKNPEALCFDANSEKIFKELTERGIMVSWIDDKSNQFDQEVYERYKKFKIKDLMNKYK